jgi:hypothetical protein
MPRRKPKTYAEMTDAELGIFRASDIKWPSPPVVKVKGGAYCCKNPVHGHDYEILHELCDNPGKLLGWLYHMSGKTWWTRRHTRELIAATNLGGIVLDVHA